MSDSATAPVMVRVDLTPAEYRRLRQLAIGEGKTMQAIVADALREQYPSITEEARSA